MRCFVNVDLTLGKIDGQLKLATTIFLKKELSGKLINPMTSLSFHRKNLGKLKINQQLYIIIIKHVNHVTSKRYKK